jgi:predicted DsbA family dithiol-disulfide isomerase
MGSSSSSEAAAAPGGTWTSAVDRPYRVEVFADVVCPFTHLGLRRLVAARLARGREDVILRLRAWPLELVNGEPMDPAHIAEEVAALRERLAPDLFAHFDPGRFPTSSVPALALAVKADRIDHRLGEQVSLGLRHALFEEGLDIGDPEVLETVAARYGLDASGLDELHESVTEDWHEGQARGVVGSPHFFVPKPSGAVGEEDFFCPTLRIARHDGHLSVSMDESAYESFVATCFPRRTA